VKKFFIVAVLLGLLGGTAMAVSPLLFRVPVIGENILMQVLTLPTGEEPLLDWSLMANPSFVLPQEGEVALLSPSQEIITGELRVKNTSSREISFIFWSEAITVYGDRSPVFQTMLTGKAREYRSEGVKTDHSSYDIVFLQPGEEVFFTLQIFAGAEKSSSFRGVIFTINPLK